MEMKLTLLTHSYLSYFGVFCVNLMFFEVDALNRLNVKCVNLVRQLVKEFAKKW